MMNETSADKHKFNVSSDISLLRIGSVSRKDLSSNSKTKSIWLLQADCFLFKRIKNKSGMKFFKATSQPIFTRKPCQKPYVSYVFCLLFICKRTPLLDTEGFISRAGTSPALQNGFHGRICSADRSCRCAGRTYPTCSYQCKP